jgi:hypothetical protein
VYSDIYDGRAWKALKKWGYFKSINNLALSLNYDGFQPFSKKSYSVGRVMMLVNNLPHHMRINRNNQFLTLIISGPKESTIDINASLRPLINDLKLLDRGVMMRTHFNSETKAESEKEEKVRARLIQVICDLPAVAKLLGHNHMNNSIMGCHKCKKHNETYIPSDDAPSEEDVSAGSRVSSEDNDYFREYQLGKQLQAAEKQVQKLKRKCKQVRRKGNKKRNRKETEVRSEAREDIGVQHLHGLPHGCVVLRAKGRAERSDGGIYAATMKIIC